MRALTPSAKLYQRIDVRTSRVVPLRMVVQESTGPFKPKL